MRNPYIMPAILSILLISGCVSPETRLQQGKHALDRGNYERAIKELKKASEKEDGDIYFYIDAYSHLGDAYTYSGQVTGAASVYRSALQMIYLKMREISARRQELRRDVNFKPDVKVGNVQNEDMRLANEYWRLKEKGEAVKGKLQKITP